MIAALRTFLLLGLLLACSDSWADLASHPDYRKAQSHLGDELPDLALPYLRNLREEFKSDPTSHKEITLTLGEALVRAARVHPNSLNRHAHAKEAVSTLTTSQLGDHPPAAYWAAQAHLLQENRKAAADAFAIASSASEPALRQRALLAHAHLRSALGEPEKATSILTRLLSEESGPLVQQGMLLKAYLDLETKELESAQALLSSLPVTSQRQYLEALLAQADGRAGDASELFGALASAPRTPAHLRQAAQVGHAEVLWAGNESEQATNLLVELVENYPHSDLLELAMSRLLAWADTNDPTRTLVEAKLAGWAKAPTLSEFKLQEEAPELSPSATLTDSYADRTGFALFFFARFLSQREAPTYALLLLKRMQQGIPNHPLTPLARIESARLLILGGQSEKAREALTALEAQSTSQEIRAFSAQLQAELSFESGDFEDAAAAFSRVHNALLDRRSRGAHLATINTGVSLIQAGAQARFSALISTAQEEALEPLKLEEVLAQAAKREGDARSALEEFLKNATPQHPRWLDARIALIEEHLRLGTNAEEKKQADPHFIAIDFASLEKGPATRFLLARFDLALTTKEWKAFIGAAKDHLAGHPEESLISLKLSEAYFLNGDLSLAQRSFQEIADANKGSAIQEVALIFAARAALGLRTEPAREEAELRLREVIALGGPLSNQARLLLAKSQEPTDALETLAPILVGGHQLETTVDAFILAAGAHREMGGREELLKAVRFYDRALALEKLPYSQSNQIHAMKGRVFELLAEPGKALEAYTRVVKRENLPAGASPTEWRWFSHCGLQAVRLLEDQKRWRAAINILRLIETSGSPWGPQAAKRREEMQLEHQIWGEKAPK